MTGLVSFALDAAARGWPVFPLRPGTKRPRPQFTNWETRATVDPDSIRSWWRRHPADNVAIATGPARLVVVDLDTASAGETPPTEWAGARSGLDVYQSLAAAHGHTPTWTVATAGGGWHLYYRVPGRGGPWRNTAGRIGWHIDTRAAGGYVVARGSIVDEKPYVLVDARDPARATRLARPTPRPTRGRHPAAGCRSGIQGAGLRACGTRRRSPTRARCPGRTTQRRAEPCRLEPWPPHRHRHPCPPRRRGRPAGRRRGRRRTDPRRRRRHDPLRNRRPAAEPAMTVTGSQRASYRHVGSNAWRSWPSTPALALRPTSRHALWPAGPSCGHTPSAPPRLTPTRPATAAPAPPTTTSPRPATAPPNPTPWPPCGPVSHAWPPRRRAAGQPLNDLDRQALDA